MDDYTTAHFWSDANQTLNGCNSCIPPVSVAFTILSSVASIVGSLLIICTFLYWKDLRTIARMILVFLAIADLLSGVGYVFGAGIYIKFFIIGDYCPSNYSYTDSYTDHTYQRLCEAQSFLTTLMPMASFLWTGNLAIYLFFSIAWQRTNFAKTFMLIFHIIAWGIPLVTCVTILVEKWFGQSLSRSSGGWCWIAMKNNTAGPSYYAIEWMAGKGWEVAVCVLALVVCVAIKIIVWKRVNTPKKDTTETEYSSITMERQLQAAYIKLDQKLIWLPIAFLLLRMWGIVRFFVSLHCHGDGKPSQYCCKIIYNPFLVFMQSVCDPGQGWSNALLFVIFNKKILHRLCPCLHPLGKWCHSRCAKLLSRPKVKRAGVVKCVSAVTADNRSEDVVDGYREDERDPLLANESLHGSVSTSSVIYSSPAKDSGNIQAYKSRNPSINSKC